MSGSLSSYGPIQLSRFLGLREWQTVRARADGLIPAPGPDGRWTAEVADALAARISSLKVAIGSLPDVGAGRAAAHLTRLYGVEVQPDTVAELARRGLLPQVGDHKGWPLYCGRTLESFDLPASELADAADHGRLVMANEAVRLLGVRKSDFGHLLRAGLISAETYAQSSYLPRRAGRTVPLFRTGTLRDLVAREDLDWAAARTAEAGAQSPFASLPDRPASARSAS